MAAQLPEAIFLCPAEVFDALNQFCFERNLQYIDVQVAGYRGVVLYGDSYEGISLAHYHSVNPVVAMPSSASLSSPPSSPDK